ncbi:hypothetical protein D3P07_08655 [Paenibacillus sp. 1011MAR3C5]|uniref:hypothetical protein n=1 Tax=Paenibacillus sp. 1011MAR3C5 TaxID=1675787 RepID=UPI000E6CEED1|nr:hypothetical protein [Paenibacillus sp. 1011MAR3C5]RJE90266.1 hypothetical protein D3P07_08655 [Paenibacillus sp. 1011MAR3C5]
MHRRTVGVVFIIIAAFLYGVRYLSAAIYGSNISAWSKERFANLLTYVGGGPLVLSWIALIVGIGLFLPDVRKVIKKQLNVIEENWEVADTIVKQNKEQR